MVFVPKISIAFFTFIAFFLTLSMPALAAEPGMILKQTSGLCGDLDIYAGKKGLKLVQKSTDCVLIMKAPDWRVNFFNTRSKVLYQVEPMKWKGDASSFLGGLLCGSRFSGMIERDKRINAATIAGLHCDTVQLVRPGTLPPDTKKDKSELKGANYFGTGNLALPPEAALVASRFYHIPVCQGFPIRLELIHLGGSKKNELDTTSCLSTMLDAATFDVPAGYKRVAAEGDVVVADKQGLLQEMSDGLGHQFGSHK
jgi:hypothetical protein